MIYYLSNIYTCHEVTGILAMLPCRQGHSMCADHEFRGTLAQGNPICTDHVYRQRYSVYAANIDKGILSLLAMYFKVIFVCWPGIQRCFCLDWSFSQRYLYLPKPLKYLQMKLLFHTAEISNKKQVSHKILWDFSNYGRFYGRLLQIMGVMGDCSKIWEENRILWELVRLVLYILN